MPYTKPPEYKRLYNSKAWKALRRDQLACAPLCCYCMGEGRLVAATVVDHRTPHKGDAILFYDRDNLQSLCKRHHDSVKQAEERGTAIGCDINGIPLRGSKWW